MVLGAQVACRSRLRATHAPHRHTALRRQPFDNPPGRMDGPLAARRDLHQPGERASVGRYPLQDPLGLLPPIL